MKNNQILFKNEEKTQSSLKKDFDKEKNFKKITNIKNKIFDFHVKIKKVYI